MKTFEELVANCVVCKYGFRPFRNRSEKWREEIGEKIDLTKALSRHTEARFDLDTVNAEMQQIFADLSIIDSTKYEGPHSHENILKLEESFEAYEKFVDELDQKRHLIYDAFFQKVLDLNEKVYASFKRTETKPGAESDKVKTFQEREPETKKETRKMKKKVFQKGQWVELPVTGVEVAKRADELQKENKSRDYGECLIQAELEILGKGQKAPGHWQFSEKSDPSEPESQVPQEVLDEFENIPMRAGRITLTKDGKWARLPNGKILPADADEEEKKAVEQFMENPEYMAGKRFTEPEKVRGFSEDAKTFTDIHGTTMRVEEGSAEENEIAEIMAFQMTFANELQQVRAFSGEQRDEITRKALQALRAAGINPVKCTASQAFSALQAGASKKFEKTLQYCQMTSQFGTFQKAVFAALA